jgi:Ni,Fe-hydrogenase maturation factor
MTGAEPDVVMELSPPVAAAVDEAVALVESLIERTVK